MSTTILLQDLVTQTQDFCQNYGATTIDMGNTIRAVNRAIEFVKQRMSLPSDKQIQSFWFYEDIPFYALNGDFAEYLQLYYNTTNSSVKGNYNNPANEWIPAEDTEILRSSQNVGEYNQFAFTTMNGSLQLLLDGRNQNGSTIIFPFDTLTGLTFSTSMGSPTIDNNIYLQGSGSMLFNVSNAESASTTTIAGQWDVRGYLNGNGAYRLSVYFPSGVTTSVLTNIEVRLLSSTGNYYSMTATTDYLGNAWASNGWSKLSFNIASASTVGTPVASAITSIQIILNHAGGFSAISNMRYDNLIIVQPDLLDLVYATSYKGTDTTGTTKKVFLDTLSDIVSFGAFAPDLILPVCLKATEFLWPQLRGDANFMATYMSSAKETMLLYGKRFPRKRSIPASKTRIIR